MNTSNMLGVKGSIINAHGFFTTNDELLKGNKLVLITAVGVITGTYSEILEDDPVDESVPCAFQRNVILGIRKRLEESKDIERLFNETTSRLLSDVKINNCGNVTKLPSMLVFADQVIGVSVGNLE